MSSCTEDYNADIADPQAWEQEELIGLTELTLAAGADINLETNTAETVSFVTYQTGTMPDGATLSDVVVEVASSSDGEKTVLTHTDGTVGAEYLQTMIEGYFGKSAEFRTLYVTAYTTLDFDGQAMYLEANSVTVNVMPKTPIVIPEFYLVGNIQGWDATNYSAAFYPVDAEAAILSYTGSISDGSSAYFKIFSAEQMGSWDNGCYSIESDGDQSLSGSLSTSFGGAFQAPSLEIYTLTIDMINNTYEYVLAEDQNPTTYTSLGLIGGFNGWGEQEAMAEITPHNWVILGFVNDAENEFKFRANDDWGISWGSGSNIGDLNYVVADNGGNMILPAGTYNVYFNDITLQAFFVTVE